MRSPFLFIAFILCTLYSVNTKADKTTITKNNGGKDGYWVVSESHTNGDHRLNCTDPGCCNCVFNSPSCNVINTTSPVAGYSIFNDIAPYVEFQMLQSNYQGQYTLAQNVVVSWAGTDSYNYTLTIDGEFSTCGE